MKLINRFLEKYNHLLFCKFYLYLYFRIYNYIHLKKRKPNILYQIQKLINELVNAINKKIKLIKKNRNYNYKVKYDDYLFLKKLFYSLVDDMIVEYVCNNECSLFSQLSINHDFNTVYDYENIKKYLKKIKKDLLNEKGNYYFICDLCSINLDCGDIIFCNGREVNYIELKKISDNVKKRLYKINYSKDLDGFDLNDKEQYLRIKKQIDNHRIIDNKFNNPEILGNRFSDNLIKPKKFIKSIKSDIKLIKHKLYVETKCDDCIEYCIINNKKCPHGKEQYDELSNLYKKYKINGENIFEYDEFIFDSIISRPYLNAWTKNEIRKIIKNEISIYIKINISELIKKLNFIIPVFKEKQKNDCKTDYNLMHYRGKNYYVLVNGERIYIGTMFVYRIAALFYTSDDTIKYQNEIFKNIS